MRTACPQQISTQLTGFAKDIVVKVVQETGSTNSDLLANVSTLNGPTLLIAHTQTQGRGRLGRTWHAEPGNSLTASLAWPFMLPVQALAGLPLAIGVAIANTLMAYHIPVKLKWPNDVLRDGKKLGGLLIETSRTKTPATTWAIIGIGLNIQANHDVPDSIGQPIAYASELSNIDQSQFIAALINNVAEALVIFTKHGFGAFQHSWNKYHAHHGQNVYIYHDQQIIEQGTAIGVDTIGRLLLNTTQGQVAICAGDVSLRTTQG